MFGIFDQTKGNNINNERGSGLYINGASDERINDRYYDINKSKDNWRMLCFALIGCLILVLCAYLWKSQQSNIQPFIYYEDPSGALMAMGAAHPASISNRQRVKSQIYRVIQLLRTVYTDPQVMKMRLQKVFRYYLSAQVSKKLNNYFLLPGNDPRKLAKRASRTIRLQGIVPIGNNHEKRWKIRWIEYTVSLNGTINKKQTWEAYLTIDFMPIKKQKTSLG